MRLDFTRKYEYKKTIKQQPKLTLDGIHISNENCDSYSFKQKELKMDKPLHLGSAVSDLSKLLMYETSYDDCNHILDKKVFNYIIWIMIASFPV